MTTAASCGATLPNVRVRAAGVGAQRGGKKGRGRSKKGAQSRAACEHPRTRRVSRPVVSFGRSTAAESRGCRWTRESTRGRQACGRADEEEHEREDRMTGGGAWQEEKRKRGQKGSSSVSYVVSVESDGTESGTPWEGERERPSVIGSARGGGRAKAEPDALFRAHNQYARRARSVRSRVCVLERFSVLIPSRKMGESRGIKRSFCEIESLTSEILSWKIPFSILSL